jgi:hypothetical protein
MQHYVELTDMVYQAIKVEEQFKRKGLARRGQLMATTSPWKTVTSSALIPTDALLNIVLFGKDIQQSLKVLSQGIAPPRAPSASPSHV